MIEPRTSNTLSRCFGAANETDDRLRPEKHEGSASSDDVRAVINGYRALNESTQGRYGEFLRSAAGCQACGTDMRIESRRKPISLLCGTGAVDGCAEKLQNAHRELHAFRRADGSLRVDVERAEGIAELRSFLGGHDLSGLSIGHCGWGDLTAAWSCRG